MGETGLVPRVEEDGNNFKMFELMYATVSKDVWQPLIPVGSWGPPDVSYKKMIKKRGRLIESKKLYNFLREMLAKTF